MIRIDKLLELLLYHGLPPEKIGGFYMDQKEKLLIGIENVLYLASDLVKRVDRLERVEEECKFLKEQLLSIHRARTKRFYIGPGWT